jgi:hypothetical protein
VGMVEAGIAGAGQQDHLAADLLCNSIDRLAALGQGSRPFPAIGCQDAPEVALTPGQNLGRFPGRDLPE